MKNKNECLLKLCLCFTDVTTLSKGEINDDDDDDDIAVIAQSV
jgi:hypothetical protein